jgi:hypothetical protein
MAMSNLLIGDARDGRVARIRDDVIDAPHRPPRPIAFPSAIAQGDAGVLILADRGSHRIVSWSGVTGLHRQTLGEEGAGDGQFRRPSGVAIDRSGAIWIADSGNRRVVRVTSIDGQGWAAFGTAGRPTLDDAAVGAFWDPYGIAPLPGGGVIVSDPGSGRVVTMLDIAGSGWATSAPRALSAPLSAVPYAGGYLVSDFEAGKVVVLDAFLAPVRTSDDPRLAGVSSARVLGNSIRALVPQLRSVLTLADDGAKLTTTSILRLEPLGVRRPVAMEVEL